MNKKNNFFFMIASISSLQALFDIRTLKNISIHNNTDELVYVAAYYVRVTSIQRINMPYAIPAHEILEIERPPVSWKADRFVYVARTPQELGPTLTTGESNSLAHTSVSSVRGRAFYIDSNEAFLHISNWFWRLLQPAMSYAQDFFANAYTRIVRHLQTKYAAFEKTTVRQSNELSLGEQHFLKKRRAFVHQALIRQFPQAATLSEQDTLTVAFGASSGGMRAMLSAYGIMSALTKLNLFDTLTYVAGVSGGAWALLFWYSTHVSLLNFIDQVIQGALSEPALTGDYIRISEIADLLIRKITFDQPTSIIDVFGALVTQKILGSCVTGKLNDITLFHERKIADVQHPYPIYTAVIDTQPLAWFECTPEECGSSDLSAWVPSWAFGRKFKYGQSIDLAPPQPLSFFVGACGSAMSVNLQELFEQTSATQNTLPSTIYQAIGGSASYAATNYRAFTQKVANPTYGMDGVPLNQQEQLVLLDAGIAGGVPLVPLMRPGRNVDLIIIGYFVLEDAYTVDIAALNECIIQRKYPIKNFSADDIAKNRVVILDDEQNLETPVILVISIDPNLEKSLPQVNTYNFEYSREQAQELVNYSASLVAENSHLIKQAYERALRKKNLRVVQNRR